MQYLCRLFTSRNAKMTRTGNYILRIFLLCEKRNDLQTFTKPAAKPFSSVYVVGTTCFDECFLFYVITGRHYFSLKINFSLRDFFKGYVTAFFEGSVLKEVRILCVISTITI